MYELNVIGSHLARRRVGKAVDPGLHQVWRAIPLPLVDNNPDFFLVRLSHQAAQHAI